MKCWILLLFMFLQTFPSLLFAGDLMWSGRYRLEGIQIHNSEMSEDRQKAFSIHHLNLSPKIVVLDGITIDAQFDIFNNAHHPASQVGAVFGSGPGDTTPTTAEDSNVLSQTGLLDGIRISQMYLNWKTEYGSFVAGRIPMNFGLGMIFNSGKEPFSHWLNTLDAIGYKFLIKMASGNLMLMPIYGKVAEGSDIAGDDDVNDIIFHIQFENPDTNMIMGFLWNKRHAGTSDAPAKAFGGTSTVGTFETERKHIFLQTQTDVYKMSIELASENGSTGVLSPSGGGIDMDASGIAMEIDWKTQNKWQVGLKAGYATGDDPSTPNKFEGFNFSRNYDVALLLFNYPLGQFDIFNSARQRDINRTASGEFDNEVVGNAIYIAPHITWALGSSWSFKGQLTYATINQAPTGGSSSLGTEWDFSFIYRPHEHLTWQTDIAWLSPGDAFSGLNGDSYEVSNVYGLTSRLSLSF